jgi:hypothetical protein
MRFVRLVHVSASLVVVVGALGLAACSGQSIDLGKQSATCSQLVGSVSFSPALTTSGTAAEHMAVALSAKGCVSPPNGPPVSGGSIKGTIKGGTSSCLGVLKASNTTISIVWDPKALGTSVVSLSSSIRLTGTKSGEEGFMVGNGAHLHGTFAGPDGGSQTRATIYSTLTPSQILAACGAPNGLRQMQIVSGDLYVG